MNIVRVWDFTVSHSSEDYRAVSSLDSDFRPFSSSSVSKIRKEWQEARARRSYFLCVYLIGFFFNYFFMRWPEFSGRSLEKVLSTNVSLTRRLYGAASRSRLSRCVLSRCVLLTLFRYTQVSWEGQPGQVDTPNPRTVRNCGWRLTGVCARKASVFSILSSCDTSIHIPPR